MRHLFINPNSGIIRAGWRITIFLVLFLVLNMALTVGVRSILGSLKGGGVLWFTLLGLSATLAAYISRKYLDRKSLQSLGLSINTKALLDVIAGVAISAAIMACMYFTLLCTGLVSFEGFSWWTDEVGPEAYFSLATVITILSVWWQFMIVAWWEELAFRGIILQNVSRGLNLKWGIALSTIFFGAIHAANPDATVLSTFLIMLISLKLVYAYLKTGQLWLAMGLHLGWNFFQASIFGFSSSGHSSPSLIAQTPVGPEWLSGGAFGAEHSILIIPFTLASLFIINWYAGKTRSVEQRFFTFRITEDTFKTEEHEAKAAPQTAMVSN